MTGTESVDVLEFPVMDSTSLYARRQLAAGDWQDRAVVISAARQTGSIGRLGRAWQAPPGGVWFTLVWPVAAAPPEALGLRVGLAVIRAIDAVLGAQVQAELKWPNDVLVNGRKVSGSLVEIVRSAGRSVLLIGVGVNANNDPETLTKDVSLRATSLMSISGSPVDTVALRNDIIARLRRELEAPAPLARLIAAVEDRLVGLGQTMPMTCADGVKRPATLLGLTEDGRMRVRVDGEELVLSSPLE